MIADILYDMNLFVDGRGYAGRIQEIKLPVIKPKMMGYNAGGMAAEVDVPMGRFEKLEAEATLKSFDKDVLATMRILPGEQFAFVARGAMVSDDGTKKPVVVTLRGLLSEVDMDTWKPGDEMPLKIGMSLRYYKLQIDGNDVYEIDPVNYKAIINGVDQLETTRQHLAI
ncbi:phage major tail tube protein [Castellaniella sp. S9]|uniref:phage major tail tube protein n=1 Tax=Castellaniella sp. S9 TaxID=2993652 RepID=UPI0022B5D0D5|nr:phage major tail tube protein [Castellaniella sp. S9]